MAHILYNSYKSKPTMAEHLWILSRVLVMKYNFDGRSHSHRNSAFLLMNYVIATCYLKMICRLKHETLSLPYIESLRSVKMASVTFLESHEKQEGQERQDANDKIFLVDFLITFLEARVSTPTFTPTPIPNILEQASLAVKDEPFQLYTKSTYREFHCLLLELLKTFQESLLALRRSSKSLGQ